MLAGIWSQMQTQQLDPGDYEGRGLRHDGSRQAPVSIAILNQNRDTSYIRRPARWSDGRHAVPMSIDIEVGQESPRRWGSAGQYLRRYVCVIQRDDCVDDAQSGQRLSIARRGAGRHAAAAQGRRIRQVERLPR
jgi:hypothetical protein